MKKIILSLIIAIVSINCMAQNERIVLNLQQVEFKESELTKTIADAIKKEQRCFNINNFYVLDFFQSSLSSGEYYLSIDRFFVHNKGVSSIAYYTIINDLVFFISKEVSHDIIKVLPKKKTYSFKNETKYFPTADHHFLIWRTSGGYYHVYLSTCGE